MSSPQQTIARLRGLRLHAMADAYQLQLDQPNLHDLHFDDRFGLIVEHAALQKESALVTRLIRLAKFPEVASLEQVEFRPDRELDKMQIASLAPCDWIRRQLNLLIIGPTGAGKTWLACAFGTQACRQKISVVFRKAPELWEEIVSADMDGSLPELKADLVKPTLFVLDDLGIGDISPLATQALLSIVDRRQKTGSMVITSQYASDKWFGLFPNPTVADALLDRIVHRSHRLILKGDSMRKFMGRKELGRE